MQVHAAPRERHERLARVDRLVEHAGVERSVEQRRVDRVPRRVSGMLLVERDLGEDFVAAPPQGAHAGEPRAVVEADRREPVVGVRRVELLGPVRRPGLGGELAERPLRALLARRERAGGVQRPAGIDAVRIERA